MTFFKLIYFLNKMKLFHIFCLLVTVFPKQKNFLLPNILQMEHSNECVIYNQKSERCFSKFYSISNSKFKSLLINNIFNCFNHKPERHTNNTIFLCKNKNLNSKSIKMYIVFNNESKKLNGEYSDNYNSRKVKNILFFKIFKKYIRDF